MDWNTLFLLAIVYSCGGTLLRAFRTRGRVARGWTLVSGFVICFTLAVAIVSLKKAGLIGAVAWALLMLAPMTLLRLAHRAAGAGEHKIAALAGSIAALLHPADLIPEQADLLRASSLARTNKVPEAMAILRRIAAGRSDLSHIAQAQLLALENRWHELAAWLAATIDPADLADDLVMAQIYLRSLGENNDLAGLINAYRRLEPEMDRPGKNKAWDMCSLYLLAFTGRPGAVRRLLDHSFTYLNRDRKDFWLATAAQAAGDKAQADEILKRLVLLNDAQLASAAQFRLAHPPVEPAAIALSDIDLRTVRNVEQALADADGAGATRFARPWMTYVLIAINVVVFIVEFFAGGTRNDFVLEKLGALNLDHIIAGHQWWRVLAANFLHFGWDHILMNMIGLYILGPFVEFSLGKLRYVVLYFASGISTMLAILILQRWGVIEANTIVGASGAIMALVGTTAAILLRQWIRLRGTDLRRRLINVIWIVGLQVFLDALSPHVSSTAHLSGVIIGFAMGMALRYRTDEQFIDG